MQSVDESIVPLSSGFAFLTVAYFWHMTIYSSSLSLLFIEIYFVTVNCWPSVSRNETYVSIEYEASSMFDLQNVVISVPLPALREAPNVRQIDGEWR